MIYLDNAATTRPNEEATAAALCYLGESFWNPSAKYRQAFAVHGEVESARRSLLSHIAPQSGWELIFTGSGSEADNQALFSAARRGNLVTTEGEHAAVYQAAKELALRGVEVRFAKLNADGSVNAENLLSLVDGQTSLVSVIHVSNETGAVNPVAELARSVKRKNPRALFHTDGVQAFGKIPFRLIDSIDFYTISAHKIGGVRGVAALVRRKAAPLHPLIFGGGQENGLRSGTENTFAIKQFEFAANQVFERQAEKLEYVRSLNEKMRQGLDRTYFSVNSPENGSPYILNVSGAGLRGEVLLHMANDRGLLIGTGSACSSKNRYSRVMLACGLDERRADGVLRISFFGTNTEEEVDRAVEILNACAAELAERTR